MKASKVMMGNVVIAIHPLTSNALKFTSFLDIIEESGELKAADASAKPFLMLFSM